YLDNLGIINIYFGSQHVLRHQRAISKSLGIPQGKVRITTPFIGGGFGGKHAISVVAYIALAVNILKKPVRLVWSREESLIYGCKRNSISSKVKLGLDKSGKMIAVEAELNSPAGPYLGGIHRSLPTAVRYILGSYWIANMKLKGTAYS